MVKIPGVPRKEVQQDAADFEALTLRLLRHAVMEVVDRFPDNTLTVDDLAPMAPVWAQHVRDELIPVIKQTFLDAAIAQRKLQREALIKVVRERGPVSMVPFEERVQQKISVPDRRGRSNVSANILAFYGQPHRHVSDDGLPAGRSNVTAAKLVAAANPGTMYDPDYPDPSAEGFSYATYEQVKPFEVPLVENPEVNKYLDTAANKLVGLGDDVWNGMRDIIIDGNFAGEGVRGIKENILAHYDVSEARAGLIARTELNRAMNQGTLMQMRQIDTPQMTKTWDCALVNSRDDHIEADGQTVGRDGLFVVGGEFLDSPGDGSADQACNCRCTMTFDLPDDELIEATSPCDEDQSSFLAPQPQLPFGEDSAVYGCSDLPLQDTGPVPWEQRKLVDEFFHQPLESGEGPKKILFTSGYDGQIKAQIAEHVAVQLEKDYPPDQMIRLLNARAADHPWAVKWWEYINDPTRGIFPDGEGGFIARDLSYGTRYSQDQLSKSAAYHALYSDVSSQLVHQWAIDSGDNTPWSVAIQTAIKDQFKLAADPIGVSSAQREADEIYEKFGSVLRTFVQRQYDETQRALDAWGIHWVEVYRGLNFDYPIPDWVRSVREWDVITGLTQQPGSSYSLSEDTARSFGSFVIKSRVPVRACLGTARTGVGCFGEEEIVVLGNPGSATVVRNPYFRVKGYGGY